MILAPWKVGTVALVATAGLTLGGSALFARSGPSVAVAQDPTSKPAPAVDPTLPGDRPEGFGGVERLGPIVAFQSASSSASASELQLRVKLASERLQAMQTPLSLGQIRQIDPAYLDARDQPRLLKAQIASEAEHWRDEVEQLMVLLETRRAEAKKAQAQMAKIDAERRRLEGLFEKGKGGISRVEFEQTKADVAIASAEFDIRMAAMREIEVRLKQANRHMADFDALTKSGSNAEK